MSWLPEDVRRFIEIVTCGDIYRFLGDAAGYAHLSRDRAKTRVFSMLYGKINRRDRYYMALQRHFPNVASFIEMMKSGDDTNAYKRFAQAEQRAESNFVFDIVVKRIINERPKTPIYTIHDSVLTRPDACEFVEGVMREEAFRWFGFVPQLQRTDYGIPESAISASMSL